MKTGVRRTAACPVCGGVTDQATVPFCSDRCRTIDLGRWLSGEYRIPTEPVPASSPQSPPTDDNA